MGYGSRVAMTDREVGPTPVDDKHAQLTWLAPGEGYGRCVTIKPSAHSRSSLHVEPQMHVGNEDLKC
jgi:hypothetical protein